MSRRPDRQELLDVTARLQATTEELEHARAQLRSCQAARDEMARAQTALEARQDEQKHLLAVAREETSAAVRRMEDSESSQLRLAALLEGKNKAKGECRECGYLKQEVREVSALHEMVSETLRARNLERSELKGTVRKMDHELKLLSEDRAKMTTHESAARRELQVG